MSLDLLANLEDLATLAVHPIMILFGAESWLLLACAL